jgi:hypothetical protein
MIALTRATWPFIRSARRRGRATRDLAVLRLTISSTFVDWITGKSARLLAFENTAGVEANQTVNFRKTGSIACEAARGCKGAKTQRLWALVDAALVQRAAHFCW